MRKYCFYFFFFTLKLYLDPNINNVCLASARTSGTSESADWSKRPTQGCKHTTRATWDVLRVIVKCISPRDHETSNATNVTARVIIHQVRWSRNVDNRRTRCRREFFRRVFTCESRHPISSLVSDIERVPSLSVSRRDKGRYHFANSTNAQISGQN